MMRRLLTAQLERWDYEVHEADDGEKAWELFCSEQFSLVLTDWLMPGINGLELTKRIREHDTESYVYVILLTAKSEKEDLVAAMDAGADDFLVKPVDPEELRVRLREGKRILHLEQALLDRNRALRETQAQLIETEKLASLGQLAAGMAHEVNNPIAYVANNLSVLKRDVQLLLELLEKYRQVAPAADQLDAEVARELAELERDADIDWVRDNLPRIFESSADGLRRVRDVVQNLRDFARLDEAEFDTLDLNTAIGSTIKLLNPQLQSADVTPRLALSPIPRIHCHPIRINQMLYNILLNAIQASQAGQPVDVRTSATTDWVTIEIQDYGCGIDRTHASRLFEPFFTTRPVGDGKGLGLAISYGIIKDHGGSIDFESKLHEGTTFRIRLPAGAHTSS